MCESKKKVASFGDDGMYVLQFVQVYFRTDVPAPHQPTLIYTHFCVMRMPLSFGSLAYMLVFTLKMEVGGAAVK